MLDTLNQQLFTNPNKVFLVIIKVEFFIPSSFNFKAILRHFHYTFLISWLIKGL